MGDFVVEVWMTNSIKIGPGTSGTLRGGTDVNLEIRSLLRHGPGRCPVEGYLDNWTRFGTKDKSVMQFNVSLQSKPDTRASADIPWRGWARRPGAPRAAEGGGGTATGPPPPCNKRQ